MTDPAAQAAVHDAAHEHAQRGTRQFLLARLCVVLSSYVMTAILTRELGPAAYGIYGVIISQLLWLEMLTNAGVPGAIAKLMADGRHAHAAVEHSARALLLGFSLMLLIVGWLAAPHVASFMRIPDGAGLLRIAILDLPLMALFTSYDGILNGRRQFGALAGAQVIYSLVKLAGVVGLMVLGFSVERVLMTIVLSTGVVCMVLLGRFPPHGVRPRGHIMREMAVLTAPIGLYLILGQILVNLDLWSLKGLWEGRGEVIGLYVASMNLAKTLMVIPGAQAGVLFASVAWAVAAQDTMGAQRHIQAATRFALIIATAAWIILVPDATAVLSLLYSRAYADSQHFLPFQLAGFGLFALLDAFSHALMAVGRRWFVASVLAMTVPLVWLSNALLIPWLGPIGAATSMVFGMGLGTAVTGAIAYRHFGTLVRGATLLRVLAAAVVVGLVHMAYPVQGGWWVLIKLPLLGGLYLLVLFILREITPQDFGIRGKQAGSAPPAPPRV